MNKRGWLTIEFKGDNSVSQVPSDWVVGDFSYWPPYKPSRMTVAIQKLEPCDVSWDMYPVSVFPGGICYDYATARRRAKRAEETSDLQSDAGNGKRKIIRKRYSSSDESGQEESPMVSSSPPQSVETNEPPPPKMKKKPVIISDEIVYPAGPSTSNGGEWSFFEKDSPVDADPRCSTSTSASTSNSNSCSNSCSNTIKTLIDQNHRLITQINLQRELLTEALQRIKNIENTVGSQAAPVEQRKETFFIKNRHLNFPLNSVEKVNELEEILSNDVNFQDAVNEFAKFGGTNIYDFVKRVLSSLITNDLALLFSWLGRQGKEAFYKLKLAKVVIDAAEKGKQSQNRKEAECTIQKWLKRACDRKPAKK